MKTHIVNGDVLGEKLKGIEGEVLVWREMYDYGPLTRDVMEEEWVDRRAAFFEERVGIGAALYIENCLQQTLDLQELPADAEITLWFEHDRYDQTMLLFLLQELKKKGHRKLSMVSINRYPGIEPFYGLGQLSPEQLMGLYRDERKAVTEGQLAEAESAWAAYTSADPKELEAWMAESKGELPYLKHAMHCHMSYFPSVENGLNEVQTLALRQLTDGARSFAEVFQSVSRVRPDDGLSDLHFAALMNELMRGEQPLAASDARLSDFGNSEPRALLEVTPEGLEVIRLGRDRFEYAGIDWWVGGVHLEDDRWRWNGEKLLGAAQGYEY